MTIKRPLIVGEIVEDFRSAYNTVVNKVEELIDELKDEFKNTDAASEDVVSKPLVEPVKTEDTTKKADVSKEDVNA